MRSPSIAHFGTTVIESPPPPDVAQADAPMQGDEHCSSFPSWDCVRSRKSADLLTPADAQDERGFLRGEREWILRTARISESLREHDPPVSG